jgi:probable F420-dependent oxidoreductase
MSAAQDQPRSHGEGAPPSFGCTLPTSGRAADPLALRDLAQAAEGLGFDAVWVSDHVVIPARIDSTYPYSPDGAFRLGPDAPYLEPLTALTYLAGCTERVRLGTHVLILPYRNPVVTAKVVATLDVLSGGRVDLGIGAGWMREEFEALGYDYFDRRGAVTDEQLRLLYRLWEEDVPAFDGEFYSFPPLGALPHPHQRPHPPVWVGGHTAPAIRRAARFGDGWLPLGGRPPAVLPPEEIVAGLGRLRREARKAGRDPAAIRVAFSTGVTLTDGPAAAAPAAGRPFNGPPEAVAADIRRYRAAGVDRFVFGFGATAPGDVPARLRRFAEQVWPAVLAGGTD